MVKQRRVLGTFTLAMITVSAIVSLRNLPLSAELGLSSVFYLAVAASVFFIPIALTTAELATGWPQSGGSYVWVSEAFGKRWGFFALWMAWMETIAWFPAILAFTAAMLAHLLAPIFPGLEQSSCFCFPVMLSVLWGATCINFLGIEASSWISVLGVILGTLIPGILIVGLGVGWVVSGNPLHIAFTWKALVPEFQLENLVFFSGILLGLAGVEVGAFHVREAKNPQRDFPRALVIAAIIIVLVWVLGALAIAVVVPQQEISLLSGLIQAFSVFLNAFQMAWAIPILALLALVGALACINTWAVGPAKGLLVTIQDGFLHPCLRTVNQKGVPTGMLFFQACVATVLSILFLWMDSHSAAYWVLTALAAQFAVVQYILMFAAVVRLRYSQPNVNRAYAIPGGRAGVWVVACCGILACVFGFWIVFIPPAQLATGDRTAYRGLLGMSFITLATLPAVMGYHRRVRKKARLHSSQ